MRFLRAPVHGLTTLSAVPMRAGTRGSIEAHHGWRLLPADGADMELDNYLLHALLIAACIPVLDVVATAYYAFGVRRKDGLGKGVVAGRNEVPEAVPPDALLASVPAPSSASAALPRDLAAQLHRLGVGFDGQQFTYAGNTYDHAADAVDYADRVLRKSNALKERLLGRRPFR